MASSRFLLLVSSSVPSYVNPRLPLRRRGVVPDVNSQPPQKRSRVDPAWLNELRSKIWGRMDLKPTLFRKAVVTREHYDILQNILNQKYPDRNTKEYDGGDHDVTSDKLYVLEEIMMDFGPADESGAPAAMYESEGSHIRG